MDIITDIGEQKLAEAAGSGSQVVISHIALGDANGVAYDPEYNQTALRNERVRRVIDSRIWVGDGSWQATAAFGSDTIAVEVREIGFFSDAGDLIAVWAGAAVVPRQTGVIEYLVKHVLNFSRVADGLIVVGAPDDETYMHAVLNATAHAKSALKNFNQDAAIRALQSQSSRHDREIRENEMKRIKALAA